MWDAPERAPTFSLVLRAVEARGDMNVALPPGPAFFDPGQSRRLMLEAGLTEPRVEVLPISWRVPSADAAFLEGGVRTRALLRAQRPEALEAIRRELRESARAHDRGGELELPTPAVMVSARKGGTS